MHAPSIKADQEALISLHDVMPETFSRMEEILRFMKDHRIPPITLLVVPGRKWNEDQLSRLQQLADEGHELAAHGWIHHVSRVTRPYHRLHATLISRNVAEHLALDSEEILELMNNSFRWFGEKGLPAPSLYVPPAWALGPLNKQHMKQLPFRQIEVLRGYLDPISGKLQEIPMVGFEADTPWRAFWVRQWNRFQMNRSRRHELPLRIGIHPNDFTLRLAHDLRDLLTS